jgi:hypothetical protein
MYPYLEGDLQSALVLDFLPGRLEGVSKCFEAVQGTGRKSSSQMRGAKIQGGKRLGVWGRPGEGEEDKEVAGVKVQERFTGGESRTFGG